MILTLEHLKERVLLCNNYYLVILKHKKEFEVLIEDDFTGEKLIIDNDFMNKKILKKEKYIELINKNYNLDKINYLYDLSIQ